MSRRVLILLALAGGAIALSGCVVVPEQPGYGYGYGFGGYPGAVRAVPPPVVVVPPPRYRHHHHSPRPYWYR
jgi:hypothetical protein